jgi:glycosyltransferase involved in cell wall biosynthesis
MRSREHVPRRALLVVHSYFLRDTRPRRHAKALADAGWEIDVLCARDEGEPRRERLGPIDIRRLPARRRRGTKGRYAFEYSSFTAMALGTVSVLHLRRRYDLVYVMAIPNLLVRAAAIPHLTRTPIVLDMRDPLPEFFRSKYGLAEDHPAVRALLAEERISCRYATHVLTVIESMRELYLRSVPPDRISVVMNAPDLGVFTAPPDVRRDPADRTILYAGTVAARYGVDLLVRAVARLRDEIPGIRLRIVGDGDLVPEVRAIAAREGIADRVTLDGPVPLDAMPGVIAGAWLGAQPHRDDPLMRFSFSTKLLEWAALELPFVASATEALTREFRADELLFVEPGDLESLCSQIRRAQADPGALAAVAARAKAAGKRFDASRERAKLLGLLEGLVARRSGAPMPSSGERPPL